jgi:hypothetical protein
LVRLCLFVPGFGRRSLTLDNNDVEDRERPTKEPRFQGGNAVLYAVLRSIHTEELERLATWQSTPQTNLIIFVRFPATIQAGVGRGLYRSRGAHIQDQFFALGAAPDNSIGGLVGIFR